MTSAEVDVSTKPAADAERAWTEFCDTVRAASRVILSDTHELDALDRSEGYRYLSRLVRAGLEGCLEFADPRAPELLRLCHETIKIGADNPDNVYLSAPVHTDYRYRIHGTRGSVHYLGIGSYEGGYGAGGSLPPAGYVTLPREVDPEAPVEIELSSTPSSSQALHLPLSPRTRSVVVRQTFMDRQREAPARLRIELGRRPGPRSCAGAELGRSVLEYLATKLERAMRERQQLPAARFFDVGHAQALREPLAVVERLYAHFGFEQAASAFAAMRSYDAARSEPAAGKHRYSLERYGLQAAEVAERFQVYTTTFAPYLQSR